MPHILKLSSCPIHPSPINTNPPPHIHPSPIHTDPPPTIHTSPKIILTPSPHSPISYKHWPSPHSPISYKYWPPLPPIHPSPQLAELVGPHICMLKTHIDILEDFTVDTITRLQEVSSRLNFIIFEDRFSIPANSNLFL